MLEKRGHRFVRYADDITIYVASKRAAERVMQSTCEFIERRLKLRVNRDKSSVGSAFKATLLGFGFLRRNGEIKVRIDPKARKRAKERLRRLTSRRWGISMERRIREVNRFTVGWTAYFSLADTPRPLSDLDEWLRRRLRQVRWKEWKRSEDQDGATCKRWGSRSRRPTNGPTRARATGASQVPLLSSVPCPTPTGVTWVYEDSPILTAVSGTRREPPDADPHVRWCGRGGGKPRPYPISGVFED